MNTYRYIHVHMYINVYMHICVYTYLKKSQATNRMCLYISMYISTFIWCQDKSYGSCPVQCDWDLNPF